MHSCPSLQQPLLTHASAGDSWTLLGKSGSVCCGVTAPFSWVLVCTGFVCALQKSISPFLTKFWQLYGGVNGDLQQEGLCHTQVCCAQSPCPCSRPLLTHTFTRDTQTQFWLSFSGRPALRVATSKANRKPCAHQRCSEGSNKPCVHPDPETPQRLSKNCV